jgi:hypothetical protein
MARLDSPTSIEILGPWLIEASHLLALDKIYDDYGPRLEESQDALINEEIERSIKDNTPEDATPDLARRIRERLSQLPARSRRFVRSRRATVYLSGGRTLQGERFSEILNHATATNEVPLGFRSSLSVSPVEVVVKVGEQKGSGHTLDIDVKPNTNSDAQEVYGALRNWVSDFEPPTWLRMWRTGGWIAAILLLALSVAFLVAPTQQDGGAAARQEARKMLSGGGITPANQTRAIELLLAIESNYDSHPAPSPSPRLLGTAILAGLAALCLSFCPKVVIGIWGGKRRLERWRLWVRSVAISVPALLVSTLAMPWILKWFGLLP